jgi:hypothetical protein
VPVQ